MIPLLALAVIPLSMADPRLECFATVAETVAAASQALVAVSRVNEVGTAIYSHGPIYCYTAPVTQDRPAAVDYRVGLVKPDKIVALMHTHPGNDSYVTRFSTRDKETAREFACDMFVYVVEYNKVILYKGGK